MILHAPRRPLPSVRDGAFSVLDFETTDKIAAQARVVEIGVATFYGGACVEATALRVHPGVPIPPEASAIHGIYDADVADRPPFSVVWLDAVARLGAPQALCGYNLLSYDLKVLQHELARAGLAYDAPPVIDVFALVDWYERAEPRRKLGEACARRGVELTAAHSAAADARATGELLLRLVEAGVVPDTIAELSALSARFRAHLDHERSLYGHWLYSRGDGGLRLGCGKHLGVPLSAVARASPGYLRWALGLADLPAATRAIFSAALDVAAEAQPQPGA